MKQKKVIIAIFAVLVVASIFCILIVKNLNEGLGKAGEPFYKIEKLSFQDHKKVYLKKVVRGITSDNSEMIVSTDSAFNDSSSKDGLIFKSNFLIYKIGNDTLYIYTNKASNEFHNLENGVTIIQIELSNPEMMDLIGYDAYKGKGLRKFE